MITDEQVKVAYKAYSKAICIPEYITKQTYKDALRAAIEAAEREAWRPIEEAPKDGTKIILYIVYPADDYAIAVGEPNGWTDIGVGYFNSVSGNWVREFAGTPTHWMPLPEPPK